MDEKKKKRLRNISTWIVIAALSINQFRDNHLQYQIQQKVQYQEEILDQMIAMNQKRDQIQKITAEQLLRVVQFLHYHIKDR